MESSWASSSISLHDSLMRGWHPSYGACLCSQESRTINDDCVCWHTRGSLRSWICYWIRTIIQTRINFQDNENGGSGSRVLERVTFGVGYLGECGWHGDSVFIDGLRSCQFLWIGAYHRVHTWHGEPSGSQWSVSNSKEHVGTKSGETWTTQLLKPGVNVYSACGRRLPHASKISLLNRAPMCASSLSSPQTL